MGRFDNIKKNMYKEAEAEGPEAVADLRELEKTLVRLARRKQEVENASNQDGEQL